MIVWRLNQKTGKQNSEIVWETKLEFLILSLFLYPINDGDFGGMEDFYGNGAAGRAWRRWQ